MMSQVNSHHVLGEKNIMRKANEREGEKEREREREGEREGERESTEECPFPLSMSFLRSPWLLFSRRRHSPTSTPLVKTRHPPPPTLVVLAVVEAVVGESLRKRSPPSPLPPRPSVAAVAAGSMRRPPPMPPTPTLPCPTSTRDRTLSSTAAAAAEVEAEVEEAEARILRPREETITAINSPFPPMKPSGNFGRDFLPTSSRKYR